MLQGAFLYEGSLGYTLYYTTNFIFTGLAVSVAFHALLFNIGGEGQAYIGGLGAGLVCLALDAVLPGLVLIPLAIVAAAAFGAGWALAPAWLQAYRGSHVVITTIMFNFIAAGVMVSLLAGPLIKPGQSSPTSRRFSENAQIPDMQEILGAVGIEIARSPLNLSFVLAIAACVFVWLLIWHTRFGYAVRTLGHSPQAAAYAGIRIPRTIIAAMAVSGGLAGLMAVNEVLGVQHRLLLNFTAGYGFTGIAVSLMGRNHPIGIVLASLLFGALYQGGERARPRVPDHHPRHAARHPGAHHPVLRRSRLHAEPPARPVDRLARAPSPGGPRMSEFAFQILLTLDATLRLATPLIFCALAGLFSERSGIIDISLEGKLLGSAFAAGAVASVTGSVYLGLLAAVGVSISMSLVHGFACITHRGNQIISGLAVNILASGLTVTLGIALFQRGGQTPTLGPNERFQPIELPFADALAQAPLLGPVYDELVSGHKLLVYLAFIAVPLAALVLTRTRFGLRLRAVGESPEAVDSAGVSVPWLRYRAVIVAGILCGIAGAYLSTAHGAGFIREMSAGKGYIALAAMIFGKWRPWSASSLACCSASSKRRRRASSGWSFRSSERRRPTSC